LLNRIGVLTVGAALITWTACGGSGSTGSSTQYNFQTPVPGSQRTYSLQVIDNYQSTINYFYTKTYNSVNPDGSFSSTVACPAGDTVNGTDYCISSSNTEDSTGHLLTQALTNTSTVCTFSPFGEGQPFPLHIGQTWTATWTESCNGSPTASFGLTNGVVVDTESVTVPAGTFNAVKVQYQLVRTPSDPTSATMTMSRTIWLDTQTGKPISETTSYSYSGNLPTNGYATQMTEQLQSYQ
jgi:hypothetical protein